MKIAIVGCGHIADYYVQTLPEHPELELVGVMDIIRDRAVKFSQYHSIPFYETLDELLTDSNVDIVLNLTNPRSHYEVSKACLEAGKHIYSEKPIAMTISESKNLVALANQQGLQITSAPCSLLGETAQTLWKAVRENAVGKVRLVYAEIDDGMIHKSSYKTWLSVSGIPWPYQDEFEIGCTIEHAGYYVTWLTAFFGPAESVTAFASCLIPNKVSDELLEPPDTPDFSVACIKFKSGVVARLTCSIVAPHNHSLKIIGDHGILETEECWFYDAPIYVEYREKSSLTNSTEFNIFKQSIVLAEKFFSYAKRIQTKILMKQQTKMIYPLVRKPPKSKWYEDSGMQMDLSRGVAEMAASITEQRPNRLSADFTLHNNELVIAIHQAFHIGSTVNLTTTFEPIEPMDWAK